MHGGKRLTKSLGTRDEKEAQKEYLKVRNRFAGQIDRGELDPTSVKDFTIGELLTRYKAFMQENGRKSAEIAGMVLDLVQRDSLFRSGRKVASLTLLRTSKCTASVNLKGAWQTGRLTTASP
jgi:hypothetical protein